MWPWPGDDQDARLRRIIHMYRDMVMACAPAACEIVDEQLRQWGQGWVSDNSIIDMNEMMSAKQLAERHGISIYDVYNWERQGKFEGQRQASGRVLYRQGDVIQAKG